MLSAAERRQRPQAQAAAIRLTGKRIYIPPMAEGSARAFASAFRASAWMPSPPRPPTIARASWARTTPPATNAIRPRSRWAIS